MNIEQAKHRANELVRLLSPYCQRIEIAGSIRRGKSDVTDIEIVAIPNMLPPADALFPDAGEAKSHLDCYLRTMTDAAGTSIQKDNLRQPAWGPRYKKLRFKSCPVDLFIVLPPSQWGLIYFLRTGPAGFSKRAVTQREKGGLLPDDCHVSDGHIEKFNGLVIDTPEESDVFRILDLPWQEPCERGVR